MRCRGLLLVALLLGSTRILPAQTWLTNRQVYDFAPGDVFHYSFTHNSPPVYTLRSILSRSESPGRDSLMYEVRDTIYRLGLIPEWNMEVREHRIVYTQLDSIPKPGDQNGGITAYLIERSADSADDCGWTNSYRWSNAPDSLVIFGRKYYLETVGEGIGKSYEHQLGSNDIVYALLSYYNKTNGCGGGRPIVNPTQNSLAERKIPVFRIYPNPAADVIRILSPRQPNSFVLFDASGRRLRQGNWNAEGLSVADLQPGSYWLEVQFTGGTAFLPWVKL
jgi:hypothetical protein